MSKLTVCMILLIIGAFVLIAGCTGTPAPAAVTTAQTPVQTAEIIKNTPEPTATLKEGPLHTAGMIVANEEGHLKLITKYNPITEKYTTRPLLKGNTGEAWLTKGGTFKELGSDNDHYSSIDKLYPILYDDLNNYYQDYYKNYYDWQNKNGIKIHIYAGEDPKKFEIGYLIYDTPESMEFVNTHK